MKHHDYSKHLFLYLKNMEFGILLYAIKLKIQFILKLR